MKSAQSSRSEKKTDEEAREELQKPDMVAFDRVMRALVNVPKKVVRKDDRKGK
jgi:hypothetical protein